MSIPSAWNVLKNSRGDPQGTLKSMRCNVMQCSAMQCNPMQWNGMYVRTYVCVYVHVYAWMNVWMYACMHVCVYAYNVPSGNQTWLSMRILNKLPCKASNHPEVWDFSTKPCCIAKGYIHIYILCIYIFQFSTYMVKKKTSKSSQVSWITLTFQGRVAGGKA